VRMLVPLPAEGSPERAAATAKRAYPPPWHATPPPPSTAAAEPESLLPMYLLHYGALTAAPLEQPRHVEHRSACSAPHHHASSSAHAASAHASSSTHSGATGHGSEKSDKSDKSVLSSGSSSEKHVAQTEARASAEPRAATQQRDRAGKSAGSGRSSEAVAEEGTRPRRGSKNSSKDADKAATHEAGAPSALPAALRATREHAEFVRCHALAAQRMREVASVLAATIEGMVAQQTPARAACLVEEARREAELSGLLAEAKAELSKLKKANRDLVGELQTTFVV
jgi:hypothetical protein